MLNTFKSTLPKVLVAAAVVAAVGAARPAAAAIVPTGTLGWSDGASEFFADVNPGAGDTFTVTFSGLPSGPPSSIPFAYSLDVATGVFVPPFPAAPPLNLLSLTGPAVGNFKFSSGTATVGVYKLIAPLAFNFANGVSITWGTGTDFGYNFNSPSSVQFEVAPSAQPVLAGLVGKKDVIHTDVLQFGDGSSAAPGTYNALVEVSVPAPLPLLGAGVAFGVSRRLRKRIKLSAAV